MKEKITGLLILACCLFSLPVLAQSPTKIRFEETTHDFGTLERGKPAEHTFVFTNQSEEPVKLQRVRASCGCTTPAWTTEAVAPGATGEIKVRYNAAAPGPFTKTVTVTYDSVERPMVLYIKGKVDQPDQAAPETFVHQQGNLAFESVSQNVGVLDSDKDRTLTFRIKNAGPQPVTIQKVDHMMMLETSLPDMTLIPGQVTTLTVKLLGERFINDGSFAQRLTLLTDDANQPEKVLAISGTLNRVLTAEDLARMPNIEFETLEFDGGSVLAGEKVVYAFKFRNTGQEDLELIQVKASCGCTATAPKDKIIPGGGESEIVATFDSRGRSGLQQKTITVTTNDPDQKTIILRLKVMVEQDPFHQNSLGPATGSNR